MRYRRCICQAHLIDLQKERAEAQMTIRKAKRESWMRFINSFNASTPLGKLWSMVRSFNGNHANTPSEPVLMQDGQREDDPKQVVRLFGEYFAHRWRIVFNCGCPNTHRGWRTPIPNQTNTHSQAPTPTTPIRVFELTKNTKPHFATCWQLQILKLEYLLPIAYCA